MMDQKRLDLCQGFLEGTCDFGCTLSYVWVYASVCSCIWVNEVIYESIFIYTYTILYIHTWIYHWMEMRNAPLWRSQRVSLWGLRPQQASWNFQKRTLKVIDWWSIVVDDFDAWLFARFFFSATLTNLDQAKFFKKGMGHGSMTPMLLSYCYPSAPPVWFLVKPCRPQSCESSSRNGSIRAHRNRVSLTIWLMI